MDARKLVRRAERDPWNRLNSILEDADWVASFCKSKAAGLPITANLRCGAWYVSPHETGSCYFKSTDGHTSEWGFSLKRYNLDLLLTIQEHNGCVIVDSTRRGKSLPDAFSKTVPIWCAVLNAASFKLHGLPASAPLITPEQIVSPSEKEQIASKLDYWTKLLLSSELPIPSLKKPLRPLFVSRSCQNEAISQLANRSQMNYYPVVLVSASQMVPTPGLDPMNSAVIKSCLKLPKETEALRCSSRYIYVQGSGDDEDMWSLNLTPTLFWDPANLYSILSHREGGEKLEATLKLIVEQNKLKPIRAETEANDSQVGDFGVFFGTRSQTHIFSKSEQRLYRLIIHADAETNVEEEDKLKDEKYSILRLGIPSGKQGLQVFRKTLPDVISAAKGVLPGHILLCSQEAGLGNDLVGGLAIAVLSTCFDENRLLVGTVPHLTKEDIKRRLQWIISSFSNFKPPSRGHLLRINEVLLSGPYQERRSKEEQMLLSDMATLSTG